jgi:hypothetical protein
MGGFLESNGAKGPAEDPLSRFRGLTIHEALRAMLESDPLRLAPRIVGRIASRALYLDPKRAAIRLAARVAFELELHDGSTTIDAWLDELAETSLRELLEEQVIEESNGTASAHSKDAEWYRTLAHATGMDVELVRLVCITLNRLESTHRRAFRALAVERQSLDACARTGLGTRPELERWFSEAGHAIALALIDRYGQQVFPKEGHGN